MNTSVFEGTMADMSYPQIEAAIRKHAAVLLPVSVMEEHGPHLCTGTDMYLTGVVCRKIRETLMEQGHNTVIAPPVYWGVNRQLYNTQRNRAEFIEGNYGRPSRLGLSEYFSDQLPWRFSAYGHASTNHC